MLCCRIDVVVQRVSSSREAAIAWTAQDTRTLVLAGVLGIAAFALRLIYSLLPLAVLVDAVLFGWIGVVLGRRRPSGARPVALVAALPSAALAMYLVVFRLGADSLRQGIGVAWLVAAAVIPLAAVIGATIGAAGRRRQEAGLKHSC